MPQIGDKHYGYDAKGMREYAKDKDAINKAMYGRSHFPMDEAKDGYDKKYKNGGDDDKYKKGDDILEHLNMDNTARTDEGGKQGDIDGDGIPESYVDSDKRKGNKKQTGWRRYADKSAGVDLELLADDLKTGNYKGKREGHKSILDKYVGFFNKQTSKVFNAMDKMQNKPPKYSNEEIENMTGGLSGEGLGRQFLSNGGRVKGINSAKNMNAPGMIKGTFNGK
tara:strand:+ start:292 stop:960 length:669 start_codon:yes stop_codon:yes gene_type:complete